ncbi:MAG: alanine racemase [Alphaproteobacteria bacterium]|nr:alanine racemase [Alphaproteobacteria bacterium]
MSIFTRPLSKIFTRPVLQINLDNLVENYRILSEIIAPATPSAVVKDDAYGLCAVEVAKVLYEKADCRNFWVAHAIEGETIFNSVPDANIFVLQGIGDDSLELFKKYQFIPVISSPEMLAFWKKHKTEGVKPVIHVETGLNRLGFREKDLKKLSHKDLQMFGMVMSHLACADEKAHFMNEHQLENFKRVREKYFPDLPATLSASDGAFLGEDFCCDMVRLGAAMYGINTAPYRPNQMKNIITLKAPVLQVADLPKGDFVGYSATYRAADNRKLAIVSIGYGDGVPRSLSNVGKVFFYDDKKMTEARILGRVSMDNIICDVTDFEGIKVGDFGYLIFDDYTLDDIARDAGTISYEILSRIGKNPRFIREYTNK